MKCRRVPPCCFCAERVEGSAPGILQGLSNSGHHCQRMMCRVQGVHSALGFGCDDGVYPIWTLTVVLCHQPSRLRACSSMPSLPPPWQPPIDSLLLWTVQAAAQEGSTAPPRPEDEVNLHFVALVQKHGKLWELDGRKSFPIDHGPSSPDSVLSDAAKVAKQFIAQTDSLSFNLIALASTS